MTEIKTTWDNIWVQASRLNDTLARADRYEKALRRIVAQKEPEVWFVKGIVEIAHKALKAEADE